MKPILISEIFQSVQGEGLLVETPSIFIRTSGCNLRCIWCDTPYTSWEPEGSPMTVAEILNRVRELEGAKHVVLTGGEPMLADGIVELAQELSRLSLHVTIETAGTVFREVQADLYSISPKLSNSTPDEAAGIWRERHENTRINIPAVKQFMAAGEYQLKFVISHPDDMGEVQAFLLDLEDYDPARVLLMPEARDIQRLDEISAWLKDEANVWGYQFCDRLHIRLFGNKRGT